MYSRIRKMANMTANRHFNTYGGTRPIVPVGVLHGARGKARYGAQRDTGGGGRAVAMGGPGSVFFGDAAEKGKSMVH